VVQLIGVEKIPRSAQAVSHVARMDAATVRLVISGRHHAQIVLRLPAQGRRRLCQRSGVPVDT